MNHYLYPKGYYSSIDINWRVMTFQKKKKSPLGTKPFQKFITVTRKTVYRDLDRSNLVSRCNWEILIGQDAVEKSWSVEIVVKQIEASFNILIDQNSILDQSRILNFEFLLYHFTQMIYSPNLYIIITTYPFYIFIYTTPTTYQN